MSQNPAFSFMTKNTSAPLAAAGEAPWPTAAGPGQEPLDQQVPEGRRAGLLLPIFSLPGPYGIGGMGLWARRFIDFLHQSGQRYWQILPLGTTGLGDSPYQNFSIEAGNPYLIDLPSLVQEGYLEAADLEGQDEGWDPDFIDYGRLWTERHRLLERAWERFLTGARQAEHERFAHFCQEQDWLSDYGLYMALKEEHGGRAWQEWPEDLRRREAHALIDAQERLAKRIRYHSFVQYLFYEQWVALRDYAQQRGVLIVGDMPIYVPEDSVEVWKEPELFQMDEDLRPSFVAGCPPDYFTPEGQLWGNVLYDWERMAQTGYAWWIRRISWQLRLYDLLRIDHFRGLESYWAVPYGDSNARRGLWVQGPGMDFFEQVKQQFGNLPLLAEDLGFLTPEVQQLREKAGLPGMNVLVFAFDPSMQSNYLPHHVAVDSVMYPATHDSETVTQWYQSCAPADRERATAYLGLSQEEGVNWGLVRGAMTSPARLCIVQLQDYLGLAADSRMNIPGSPCGNWRWRVRAEALNDELSRRIRDLTFISGRLAPEDQEKAAPPPAETPLQI